MSRATQVSPFSGRCCALPTPLPGPGLWYPGVNAQFELLGVSGFELALLVFLGKLITCITGGVRVREEQWELVTPLVCAERSKLR
jgi:hypothetical protein